MQFLRGDIGEAERAIAGKICDELFAGRRVLWLVSGGSNIKTEVEVMRLVRDHCGDKLGGLAVMPMDERYGPPGHKDSNAQQLREAGFEPGEATFVDVLTHGVPLEQTIAFYTDVAATAFASAGVIIGQFGMGDDGHVAGVKPDSPAADADEVTVAGYEWEDFTRLTLTPVTLARINVAYLLAYGSNKKTMLKRLQANKQPLNVLPAVLLYEIPEVYVYNDQIESEGNR
ncbi:MAG: 6-phosphogluconolactonase [Candidatus Saccharibacteria bacterium]